VHVPPGQELHVEDDIGGHIPKIEDGPWPAFPSDCTSIALTVATQARGTVLFFAPATPEVTVPSLPFNNVFFRTDLTVTTSYGASPADYAEALELIRSRRVQVRDMITHRLGLSAAARGFTLVTRNLHDFSRIPGLAAEDWTH